jgi:competence protein ComEC
MPVATWFGIAAAALVLSAALLWRRRVPLAWSISLIAWMALGGFSMAVERSSVPRNHVSRLLAQGRIDTSEPLRWTGRLRENPMEFPWGRRFEIDLESVEIAGEAVPVSGGLRLNLYRDSRKPEVTADRTGSLQAGDRIEALARARPPKNFQDPGAFDAAGYLARQRIDLVSTLRSDELLEVIGRPRPTLGERLARIRGTLLSRLSGLFTDHPEQAAILRAMLLGDRAFVESQVAEDFQKTSSYHVLVVAGLHVGAITFFLYWICRKLRFGMWATILVTLAGLAAYVGVVEDRTPIFRAALVAATYLCARPLFRRVELLNAIALAAWLLLIVKPSSLLDSSFQLSFCAALVIASLALPWLDRSSVPYRDGLKHLGDATRDGAFAPKVAQFRLELRAAIALVESRFPRLASSWASRILTFPILIGLRAWELIMLSAVIQWGMMPLLARDFHRVSLIGPLSNFPLVLLTGLIVPLGFLALGMSFFWMRLAQLLEKALSLCCGLLLTLVRWFAHWPHLSYGIPGPPAWLLIAFFILFILLASAARRATARARRTEARRQPPARSNWLEWVSGAGLAGLTILIAIHPFAPKREPGKLEVDVLDVGQGDSVFVAFPASKTMLIDGGGVAGSEWTGGYHSGPDVGEQAVSPFLWSRGLKKLDIVALTHAHHDHLDGLHSVLNNFQVGELWIGRDEETSAFEQLVSEANARGVRIVHKMRGDSFEIDGVHGEILWPDDPSPVDTASNDDSMVIRLTDGSIHFLLAGDIQKKSEQKLVAGDSTLAAEFLKVPHHGSKTSSTPNFVAAVAPRFAAISAGEGNPFGHPAEPTLERYEQARVRLLRTDRDGEVIAMTDGSYISVQTFAELNHR